jgi:DNA-binding CsgD family transcriptional regulator
MFEPEVLRARAWASWLAGDNPTAATLLGVALILANRSGSTALAAAALHDGVRLGLLPGVTAAPALARLATEGGLGALRAAHVRALVEGNSTALLEVSDAYEATGLVLLAAEAAASATGLLRRAGDRNRADAAARRARDRADRCEGAVPIGIDLVGDGALLTGREREVAELAATGLPSRTIAERLDISPRTVDNLLARAYQKLGITSRRDLPGALDPFGLDA